MKVLAINGSCRKDGNTAILINRAFKALEAEGIETEMVQLAGEIIRGCVDCGYCKLAKDGKCAINNDPINEIIQKMIQADGIILGSPTYFADISPELKALIDRTGRVCRCAGNVLKYKPGAAVIAVRRGGAIHAFDSINHYFQIQEMIIPGCNYWNIGFGGPSGQVAEDDEAMATMRILGENMAYLLKKLQ
ncbi:MAG: flavodoxin family protein [Phycisphaerae bacterium]|nr:flavodoxin family protein [Phycisphaerae bacterium]